MYHIREASRWTKIWTRTFNSSTGIGLALVYPYSYYHASHRFAVRILAATESNRSIPIRPTIPRYVGHVHVNANARERAVGVQCGRTWWRKCLVPFFFYEVPHVRTHDTTF